MAIVRLEVKPADKSIAAVLPTDETDLYNGNSESTFNDHRRSMADERALELLFRVMRALRWAGIAPYHSLRPPRVSRAYDLYGKTLCICSGGLMLASYGYALYFEHSTLNSVLSQMTLWLLQWCAILCTTAIYYFGMFNAVNRLQKTFGVLKSLNQISRSIRRALSTDPGHRQTCFLFLGTECTLAMLGFVHFALWARNGVILPLVFSILAKTLTRVVVDNVMMQFIIVALTINLAFRTINDQMEDMLIKERAFDDHQPPHQRARSLSNAYVATCRVVRQHNDSEKLLLLLLPYFILIELLNSTSFTLSEIKDEIFSKYTSLGVLWYILHVSRFLLLVAPSYNMSFELERTQRLIRKLMHTVQSRCDPLLPELETFQLHLALNKPAYVLMGLYTMKRSLVLAILAVCTTYVMIFQEF